MRLVDEKHYVVSGNGDGHVKSHLILIANFYAANIESCLR